MRLAIAHAISHRRYFDNFTEVAIRSASILPQRYKFASAEDPRNTKQRNRDFATDDLRMNRSIDYARYKIPYNFPTPARSISRGWQFISEISTPKKLAAYKIDFSPTPGLLRPDQNTVNAISEQLSRDRSGAIAFSTLHLYLFG